MNAMSERRRVLTLLGGGRPDRVPWFGDLDYWATALIGRGEKPADFKAGRAYIDWHRSLRVGYYLQGDFPFRSVAEDCRVDEWREGPARRRRVVTPRGALTETWTWLPGSFAEAPTEHLVKGVDDLAAYRWLYEHTRYEPDDAFARRRAGQVGDQGLVLCYLPKSPFMQLVALDAGIAAVAEMAADAPGELAETLAAVRAAHDRAARMAVDSPAEVLMIPENLSSEVVGPRFYELYMRDYHETWCRAIAAAGKISCVHLDGTLKGLLRQVASAGFTFIEAMTPAPVGDLDVGHWAGWCPDSPRTVFWGGLPGVYFTEQVSEAEFERHTREVLEVMRAEPRYVLGVADQVPPDGLERRVRCVAELADAFGSYR